MAIPITEINSDPDQSNSEGQPGAIRILGHKGQTDHNHDRIGRDWNQGRLNSPGQEPRDSLRNFKEGKGNITR